jgi:oligopeptide/dipeptide ABC transporter ATP-binding protein
MNELILEVQDLVVSFDTEMGSANAVDGLSFGLRKGSTLGIVGESGCGKSVSSLAIMRLLPQPAGKIIAGKILFAGQDIVQIPANQMRGIRGNRISMIFQEPMSALNPVLKIGEQIGETFHLHQPTLTKHELKRKTVELMDRVGIPSPEKRIDSFPHQLSGGMRQRVVIAIALACRPNILIADEPTTALDVTIQAQILDLICELQREMGMSVIFITHDLGVIAQICDDVLVMYGGRAAEQSDVKTLFAKPKHPYTQGLLQSIPRLGTKPKTLLPTIKGMVPSLHEMPLGCRFQNRCPHVQAICKTAPPPLAQVADGHEIRCYRWKDIT